MTGLSIGQIVAGMKPAKEFRTFQPVWRNSSYEGHREQQVWRPIGIGVGRGNKRGARRYAAAVIKAAESLERRSRATRRQSQPGVRNGALGDVALGVLRALYDMVDYATGRLEPAVATIAERTGYCYSAVHKALGRLREQGFLQWIRRSRPTENKGEAGPQVEQIPNAYGLTLPKDIEASIRHLLSDGPTPDDEQWRRDQAKQDLGDMIRTLSTTSEFQAQFRAADPGLDDVLARLAAAWDANQVKERESSTKRETGGSF